MAADLSLGRSVCPDDGADCDVCNDRQRARCEVRGVERRREEARKLADRERRGKPQRFKLTGPHRVDHGDGDYSLILLDSDPDIEWGEVIEVVEAAAYDRLAEAVQRHLDTFGYDNHEGLADALAGPEEN